MIKAIDSFLDCIVEEIEAKTKISTFLNPQNSNTGKINLWVELIEVENLSNELMSSYEISFEVRAFIFYTYGNKTSHDKAFEIVNSITEALCIKNLCKVISEYSILGIRNTKISIKRPDIGNNSDSFRLDMYYKASIRQSISFSDLILENPSENAIENQTENQNQNEANV